jgi:hypothetical protein
MALESVVELADVTRPPTYAELVSELDTLQESVERFSENFLQLGALFLAAQSAGARRDHVLDAGRYLADDLANAADCMREAARDVVEKAKPAIPAKQWHDCPCPECNPRNNGGGGMSYVCMNAHFDGPKGAQS